MTSAVDWLISKFKTNFARNSKFHIRMTILCQLWDTMTPALRKLHRSKIFVVVSQRHREYRSTIAVVSWPNNRVIRPRSGYASATLCAILLRSVRSRYNLATTNALPRRLCYLDIANLGASTTHSIEHKPVSFVGFIQKEIRIATKRELHCKGRGRVAMA